MAEEAVAGSGHKCKFKNHGIKLVSKSRPLDGIRLVCRSSRQEQIRTDFIIGESEKQLSRPYHFQVDGAGDGLKLKIKMPIFRCPREAEEIVIKTDGEQELKVLKLKQGSKKLLRNWRDGNSHKEDKGIPELLSSTVKCGKLSCCNYIRRCLKLWREQHFSADVSFHSWIERAYADSNMLMPTIYPRPMSDQYLVLLCECLKPTPDLAHALNISHQEYESIIHSHFYIDDMMKLLKIFMIFRERQEDLADALQYLLDCLYNLGYKGQWSRGVACINGWLNRHAEVTDSLRNPIEKLLARIKSNKRSPRLLLKRWNTAHVGVFRGLSFSRQRSATASQSNSRLRTSTLKPHRSLYSFAP